MSYNLFLDDVRFPEEVGNYIIPVELGAMYRKEHWVVCRDVREFQWYIIHNGLPDKISFDHDLAPEHYAKIHYHTQDAYNKFFKACKEQTGYDAAKWLCNYCEEQQVPLPTYFVHSQNPVGAKNIRTYLENFEKHVGNNFR